MIYFIIATFLFCLSFYYDINGRTGNKEFWYRSSFIVLVCLAGMRYRIGVDTTAYNYTFYHANYVLSDVFSELKITEYPFWKVLNSVIYTVGGRFFYIQFIHSFFVNFLIFKYIKKHSHYIFTCVFLYYIWLYPGSNFEEMKQSMAMAISLFANDYILNRKYIKGVFLFVLATLFHVSVVIVAFLSFMFFLRINLKGVLFVLFGFILGTFIQQSFEGYISYFAFDDLLFQRAEHYTQSEMFFARSSTSFYYFIYKLIPLFVSLLAFFYVKKKKENSDLIKLEQFLVIGFFFLVLSTIIVITYRFVNYYTLYIILFISQGFVDTIRNEKENSIIKVGIPSLLLIFYIWTTYVGFSYESDRYRKFYPYASVIEREIDKNREKTFNKNRVAYPPNYNEY